VPDSAPELVLVMPVYNEEASVRKVVNEWFAEIENWTENFVFLAIDDGSGDRTLDVLQKLRSRLDGRLAIHSRPNRGHGQSCLEGYRMAADMGAKYVFQIDSDGQCDPQYFFRFWRMREQFDVVYGIRTRRDDGVYRLFVSMFLRFFILASFRVFCPDANVPYRLMRVGAVMDAVNRIPPDYFLANVGLAILLARESTCRHGYVPIRFRERYGGEPSVRAGVFAKKAMELYSNTRKALQGRK
jgi:dolichol-phosphate mannosyltransferase